MSGHGTHRNYVKIWGILMVLLVVSVVGPLVGIPLLTLVTAFGIALVKAYMVAKNFMHLDVEKPIIHWAMGIALVFMVLLFAGVSPDVMKDSGQRWKKDEGFHPAVSSAHGGAHGGSHSETPGALEGSSEAAEPGAESDAPASDTHDGTGSGH